jgi:DNA-binding NarL/FixJ family response regulator
VKLMRILLADDETKVRFALRVLLERQPGLEVVGEAANAEELLAQARPGCPDLVLLDWDLPGAAHVDLLEELRLACPDLRVVALSARPEARQAVLEAGAQGFVCKCDAPERLLSAIAGCECE